MNQTESSTGDDTTTADGCGVELRHIELDHCTASNPRDCLREFHVYLPSILCRKTNHDENDDLVGDLGATRSSGSDDTTGVPADIEATGFRDVGTLPLVFAVHCFGCSPASMEAFVPHANDHHAVLVIPTGIKNSFNARHCCGYALDNSIDDVSFFEQIIQDLSGSFSFVRPDSVYAVGWSNGGFMVFEAASLFRAISPISGYLSETASELKKDEKVFCVDGVCVKAKNPAGRGLFMHHGIKDKYVRPTGCCSDPDKPKCCCDIEADTCVPIKDVAVRWAIDVNSCLEPVAGDTHFVTSFADGGRGITCLTASGKGCVSNTTICLHGTAEHFNHMPSFGDSFPMCGEVLQFFAQDACDGTWLNDDKACACDEGKTGVFCLDDNESLGSIAASPIKLDLPDIGLEERADNVGHSTSALLLVVGMLVFVLAFRNRWAGRNKKSDDVRYELVPRRSRN